MSIVVNAVQAKKVLAAAIKTKLVPMMTGSPGCGKSAIVHQLAEEYNLKVVDVRLAQCDPTDLLGFPDIDRENSKARYVPMNTFPIMGDDLPEEYDGWLLFLDEFNSADRAVQKAAYKLVLDRQVGEFDLHKNVAIVAAGNLDTDNAIVEEMSTALQSRMVHLQLDVDQEAWLAWASSHGIDHRITSYIKYKPANLYNFSPDHTDRTYASPRTWEFANRFLQNHDMTDELMIPLLSGTVSEGVAREFVGFTRIYHNLPGIQEIIAMPESVKLPDEPSTLFALTGLIANNATDQNIEPIMKYVTRLPIEFQVICLREMYQRDQSLLETSPVNDWVINNSSELF